MAISTTGEAQAVNQLARLIFGLPLNGIPVPDSDTACEALALLADSAYRKYGAGIDGKQVRDLWPRARGCSCNRDSVECNHEAARSRGEATIARLRDGIEDVAIRSLRHCEDQYGHDDQARLNLRALLDDTAPNETERTVIPAYVLGGGDLTALGFVLGDPVDDDPLMQHATLPTGWQWRPPKHPGWVFIDDQHGRPRIRIFNEQKADGRRRASTTILNVAIYIRECVTAGQVPTLDEVWATRDEVLAALERLRFYEQDAVTIWGDRPTPSTEPIVQQARANLARIAEIRAALDTAPAAKERPL